jgi:hypothetical protein
VFLQPYQLLARDDKARYQRELDDAAEFDFAGDFGLL